MVVKLRLMKLIIMNFKKILFIFSFMTASLSQAQVTGIDIKPLSQYPADKIKTDDFGEKYYYDEAQKARIYEVKGETVIVMDELIMIGRPQFNNQLDKNYYAFLNKKLNRVYPLFLIALYQYRDLQKELDAMDGRTRKKYAKQKQEELAKEYETRLRDLTTSEGQVFAKLMNRATGKTVYDIIKELRGGWSAFWWNVKGNIAEVDLKVPYDPHAYRADAFVENLLQSNWNQGYLKPYEGASDFKVNITKK